MRHRSLRLKRPHRGPGEDAVRRVTDKGGRGRAGSVAIAGAALLGAVGAAAPGAHAAILISDPFDYADGNLDDVAPDPHWSRHSGILPQLVASGRAVVEEARSGDHNRQFTPYTTGTVYAAADVTVNPANLPQTPATATDAYFFHLG